MIKKWVKASVLDQKYKATVESPFTEKLIRKSQHKLSGSNLEFCKHKREQTAVLAKSCHLINFSHLCIFNINITVKFENFNISRFQFSIECEYIILFIYILG